MYKINFIKNDGISLIEIIMSMLIISIVFTGLVMSFKISLQVPAKKNIQLAADLATNYLNEILSKDFPTSLPCSNVTHSSGSRSYYNDICAYNNLVDYGAKDFLGNSIPGLENFNVYVVVDTSNNATLGNLTGSSTPNTTAQIARIDVTVTNSNIPDLLISTYKGNYE